MKFYSHFVRTALMTIVLTVCAFSQGTLQGIVTDAGTGKPLIGANIFLRGTALGGVTDIDGKYKVVRIPAGPYKLRISYIGYKTKEADLQVVNDRTIVHDEALAADAAAFDAVLRGLEALGVEDAASLLARPQRYCGKAAEKARKLGEKYRGLMTRFVS
jgi:hypothetical protein